MWGYTHCLNMHQPLLVITLIVHFFCHVGRTQEYHHKDGWAKQGSEHTWCRKADQEGALWCIATRTWVCFLFVLVWLLHYLKKVQFDSMKYNWKNNFLKLGLGISWIYYGLSPVNPKYSCYTSKRNPGYNFHDPNPGHDQHLTS